MVVGKSRGVSLKLLVWWWTDISSFFNFFNFFFFYFLGIDGFHSVTRSDPSNIALPQQPLHQCLFPRTAGYRDTFQLVTNPYKCEINGSMLLGHSGQPVSDIARYSNIGQKNGTSINSDIDILEETLKWQHLAPTAPDTLPCFPFKQRDPFVSVVNVWGGWSRGGW